MAKVKLSNEQLEQISSASGISLIVITELIGFLPIAGSCSGQAVMSAASRVGYTVTESQAEAAALSINAIGILGGADGPTS